MATDTTDPLSTMSEESSFGWMLADITRMMGTEFNRRLKESGLHLSRTQWRILARLLRNNGQTQTQLAEQLAMEKAPLGVIIEKLEVSGLISRRPDSKDGRVKRVFLTPAAEKLSPKLHTESDQLTEEMLAGLSQMRRLQLSQMLGHILQNLHDLKETKA